ncbi:F-box/FBD/LRR-repeat protein At1g13570-like [Lycium ferocissimum]|uniref:F-box/FBD/LRR-repeat protein At1g13570-like n=1 Tax=Lycium ferocissimum TaxID=112874 RepID=UPI00281563D6|nr:F-box/FBD/LRR-repeat protein At1g13570-like [Lycium ferocissimum]
MLPEGKGLGCQRVPPVTISNLPNNVIDVILMCLPLRDAVRTSILSKKWRYVWSRLPELTLDQTLWETTKDFISPTIKFTNIIYHILTLHSGPIMKFTLSIPNLGNCPKFDNLMYFLSKNDIQDLVLYLPNENPYSYKLPSSFFTCLRMRHLALANCLLHPPPDFNGFDRLVSLELYEVTITSKSLESLVNRSPLLERLGLRGLYIQDHIQVNAANLSCFKFTGSIKSISFKNVPLLEELFLWDTTPSENAGESDIAKWFDSCHALEHLHVNHGVVQSLAAGAGEVLTKLPCAFNCLRRLRLSDISLRELDEVSGAFCLIRSSPYLHDMEIKVFNDDDGEIPALDCYNPYFVRRDI